MYAFIYFKILDEYLADTMSYTRLNNVISIVKPEWYVISKKLIKKYYDNHQENYHKTKKKSALYNFVCNCSDFNII